jgi:hypothetical protein
MQSRQQLSWYITAYDMFIKLKDENPYFRLYTKTLLRLFLSFTNWIILTNVPFVRPEHKYIKDMIDLEKDMNNIFKLIDSSMSDELSNLYWVKNEYVNCRKKKDKEDCILKIYNKLCNEVSKVIANLSDQTSVECREWLRRRPVIVTRRDDDDEKTASDIGLLSGQKSKKKFFLF